MITMKDSSLTVYPNREQMLALIQARAAAATADRAEDRSSAESEPEPLWPNCVFSLEE
jgi:hypothetical protein